MAGHALFGHPGEEAQPCQRREASIEESLIQKPGEIGVVSFDECQAEIGLVAKVVIEAPLGNSCCLQDLIDSDRRISLLGQMFEAGANKALMSEGRIRSATRTSAAGLLGNRWRGVCQRHPEIIDGMVY